VRISDNDILRHVGARAAEAGRVYHRQGRVVAFEESPPEIVARVQGSSPTPYSVRVKVAAADGQGPRIEGACSCPVGAYCKHIAATLIESRTRNSCVAAGRKSEPLSPTPGRQAQGDDPLPPHISQWIAALERSQASDSEAFPPDAPNRLIYVFSAPEYRHAPSFLQVEALSVRVLKSGGFSSSASKPDFFNLLSENPPRYIRPSDVKIVRWLSVARGTAYSGPIRLRDDAAWEIIEAAIATGRARLDSLHSSPLTLGPDRPGQDRLETRR
jgi:hypothetical protein